MSDKYIIRNCPACRQYQVGIYTCDDLYDCDLQRCQDCTDCVMKQIYEICKRQKESSCVFAVALFADRILQLLDIQECE